jgi:hypothetical protein
MEREEKRVQALFDRHHFNELLPERVLMCSGSELLSDLTCGT